MVGIMRFMGKGRRRRRRSREKNVWMLSPRRENGKSSLSARIKKEINSFFLGIVSIMPFFLAPLHRQVQNIQSLRKETPGLLLPPLLQQDVPSLPLLPPLSTTSKANWVLGRKGGRSKGDVRSGGRE